MSFSFHCHSYQASRYSYFFDYFKIRFYLNSILNVYSAIIRKHVYMDNV